MALIMMGLMMWRRRRLRRQRTNVEDAETTPEKGDQIYDEIDEDKRVNKEKKKKKKEKKKTKAPKPRDDPHNNNDDEVGPELVAMDTAPDIITSHDNESIYETLDSRRAARAKAGHVTTHSQSEDCNDFRVPDNYPANVEFAPDSTYDHLHRYNKPRFPRHPSYLPEKRFTDFEVVTRTKVSSDPRTVHSADYVIPGGKDSVKGLNDEGAHKSKPVWVKGVTDRFGSSPVESPSGSLRSSLTERARHSVSGGKRIVCQLTMVGVVENGKPVPVSPAAASNAYFILEPGNDPKNLDEGRFQRSPTPKLRIKSEASAAEESGACVAGGGSDYFVLEPLSQQEDLKEFVETPPHPRISQSCEDFQSQEDDIQCSSHGHPSAGSFRVMKDGEDRKRQQSFRNTRVSSCPGDCSFTDDTDEASALPSKHNNYGRSFSSPQSSQYRRTHREKESSPQTKMDAETLKARIQREMAALFLSDPDDVAEKTDAGISSNRGSQNPEDVSCPERPPANNYFDLEPQLNRSVDETEPNPVMPPESCETVDGEKSRCFQRRQTPSPPPPPLPKRNGHNRSKSETPAVICGQSPQPQSEDQGPVIVSLKRHRELLNKDGSASLDGEGVGAGPDEAFRPRFKSESGILSKRRLRRH
ncbi:hypothetical protein ACOMHN_045626 [Nucella lapillus]